MFGGGTFGGSGDPGWSILHLNNENVLNKSPKLVNYRRQPLTPTNFQIGLYKTRDKASNLSSLYSPVVRNLAKRSMEFELPLMDQPGAGLKRPKKEVLSATALCIELRKNFTLVPVEMYTEIKVGSWISYVDTDLVFHSGGYVVEVHSGEGLTLSPFMTKIHGNAFLRFENVKRIFKKHHHLEFAAIMNRLRALESQASTKSARIVDLSRSVTSLQKEITRLNEVNRVQKVAMRKLLQHTGLMPT